MAGIDTLRAVLMRLRCEDQDGFPEVGPDGSYTGHCGFVTAGLPQATPEELDELMELAAITPDPIITLGRCVDCLHARPEGTERGYSYPCVACMHPQHSHFTPLGNLTRTAGNHGPCECSKCANRKKKVQI